jgi:hypothetical protein
MMMTICINTPNTVKKTKKTADNDDSIDICGGTDDTEKTRSVVTRTIVSSTTNPILPTSSCFMNGLRQSVRSIYHQ